MENSDNFLKFRDIFSSYDFCPDLRDTSLKIEIPTIVSPSRDKQHGGLSHTKTERKGGVSYGLLAVCGVISVIAVSGTLLFLLRNYKKRWKTDDNMYEPPVRINLNCIVT